MVFSFFRKIFSRGNVSLEKIEDIINYKFQNKTLLYNAMSHRSSVENNNSNERLEHLGDAVLGLVVSEFLYKKFTDYNEGDLTKLKSALVNETVLSKVSAEFKLCDFILLSPEEEKAGGKSKPSIMADAVEALFGAVYLDGGLDSAKNVIRKIILNNYGSLVNDKALQNYKGELLELIQKNGNKAPRYEVIDQIGPDHDKVFVVAVLVNGEKMGTGKGSSKKEAEQNAAREALLKLKKKTD